MTTEIESIDFLLALKKHYKLLIVLPLLSAVAAGVISLRLPKFYRTTAVLYVISDAGKAGSVGSLIPGEAFPVGILGDLFGITQSDYLVALLKSKQAARKVIHKLKLGKNKDFLVDVGGRPQTLQALTKIFMKDTKVSKDVRTGQVEITVEGRSPKLIADMANELAVAVESMIFTKGNKNLDFLERQVIFTKKEMARAQEKVTDYQGKHSNVALSADIEVRVRLLASLKEQKIQAEVKLADVDARLQSAGTLEMLAQLRVEKEALERSLSELNDNIASEKQTISELPGQNMELARLINDFKMTSIIYETLKKDYDLSKLKKERESIVFQVIDRAEPPEGYFKPSKRSNVMMGFFAALILSVTLAFFLEYMEFQRKASARPSPPSLS